MSIDDPNQPGWINTFAVSGDKEDESPSAATHPSLSLSDTISSIEETIGICTVCEKEVIYLANGIPLREFSPARWIHYDCKHCAHCNQTVADDRILHCLRKDWKPSHAHCAERALHMELAQRPVVVTQDLIDRHNEMRLMFIADMDMSENTNMLLAANAVKVSRFLHEMPLETFYMTMKRMEAVAAEMNLFLNASKRKEEIRLEISQRDKKKVKEAEKYRDNVQFERDKRKETEAERLERERSSLEKKQMLDAEREDPQLKANRKAIESLMKTLKMSKEAATKMFEGMNPTLGA